jgi:hypothetical protein
MNIVPLSAVASQTLNVTLGGQACTVNVYQKNTGVYFDLFLNGVAIVTTKLCLNLTRLLGQSQYLGFVGDFVWNDTQGSSDPYYTGIGSRFVLVYVSAADLAAA